MTKSSHRCIEQCMDCDGSAAHADVMWQTLPVPWFGDLRSGRVEVATVGLNPSWTEFETKERNLRNTKERLPAIADFGAKCRRELNSAQSKQAAAARTRYFVPGEEREPHPYLKKLQGVMAAAVRATGRDWAYASGTALHLDIVACSTWPEWGKLSTEAQEALVSRCFPKFAATLSQIPSAAWLLLDGRTVFDTVRRRCDAVVSLETAVGENPRLDVWRGRLSSAFGNREFLGWSNPVGRQKNQQPLVAWLRSQVPTEEGRRRFT